MRLGSYLVPNALMRRAEEPSLIAGASPFFDGQLLTTLGSDALDLTIQVSKLEFFASASFHPYIARSTFIKSNVVWYTFVFKRTQVVPVCILGALTYDSQVGIPPRFAMKVNVLHG